MKTLPALLFTTVLTGAVAIAPAYAADAPAKTATTQAAPQTGQKLTDAEKKKYNAMLKDATAMTGYIGIANIALLYHMTDEAKDNVQKALVIARKLEGETAQMNGDIIKLGKLRFHSATGEKHDYWLPVVNDTMVVNSLDSEYFRSKEPNAAEEDAQMVNTRIALNTKQVRDALEKAASAISAWNYGDAQVALMNAAQSTFTDQTISDLPLVTARDNLVLARNLAKLRDYNGAGFALTHAKDALTEYQKTAGTAQNQDAQKLRTDISALQADITKDKSSAAKVAASEDKPTLTQSIESHISTWIHDIESMGSRKG